MHSLCIAIRFLATPSATNPRPYARRSAHSGSAVLCAGFTTSASRRETLSGSTLTNSSGDSSQQSFSHVPKARLSSSRISAAVTRHYALVTSCVRRIGIRRSRVARANTLRPSKRRSSTATTWHSRKSCRKPSVLTGNFWQSSRRGGLAASMRRAGRALRSFPLAALPAHERGRAA